MAIRVARNAAGNCVVFYGQTNPVYFNACLTAIVDGDAVSVRNDIASVIDENGGSDTYEFYHIPYTEFRDAENASFESAQQAADYINSIGNVTDVPTSGQSFAPGETINFYRDETSTSILFSNGDHHGVNSIKAIVKDNGRVGIFTINAEVELYEYDYDDMLINGASAGGNAQTVVNNLNALFTVSVAPAPVPTPVYLTEDGVDVAWNSSETFDPAGDDLFGAQSSSYHGARVWTTETINEPGEFFEFTFKNTVSGGGALIGIGLYDAGSESNDLSEILNDNLSNSGHHGYWFSNWFYNYNGYTAPWTTYGSNSGLVYGPGWNGPTNKQFRYSEVHDQMRDLGGDVRMKCGITDDGFVGIWYFDAELANYGDPNTNRSGDWILCARSGTPVPEGEYGLLVKLASTSARITSLPRRFASDPAAPTLYYRYIESPDGAFEYPLFASEEEANYVDLQNGGTGTSHQHIYADDPSGDTWYMPDTGSTHVGASAPPIVPGITYTEIPSLTDNDLAPAPFADTTITVDELSTVNYQLAPVDVGYTTSIGGIPNWSLVGGTTLYGVAPEVTGDNVANPQDTTTVTVYRTNDFGTSSGTLTINITNLTTPVTPISGWHHENTSTALVDSDTLADGSVVRIQDHLVDGDRVHFDSTFMTNSVLAALNSVGNGVAKVYVGVLSSGADLSSVTEADFDLGAMYYKNGTNDYRVRWISGGAFQNNTGLGSDGSTFQWELLLANDGDNDFYEISTSTASSNPENAYLTSGGGNPSSSFNTSALAPGNKYIHVAVTGTTMDISTTGVDEHSIPTPPVSTNDTSWTKALDFSGSAERAEMVSNSLYYNPMLMDYQSSTTSAPSTAGDTSNDAAARPWATAVVFSPDGHNSNQHIWNIGEGAGSDDDNIYLRIDSSRNLFFGWGRDGALNEYFLARVGSGSWYGVYVGFNGTRLSGNDATPANLAAAFDIRLMFNTGSSTWGFNPNPMAQGWGQWTTSGGRMDRSITGGMNIGGRGTNRNFHGKVASFVTTTLKRNSAMPDATEIEEMITDPVGWLNDYKVGELYRPSHENFNSLNFSLNNLTSASATQVYLMGDGTSDSYSNMIRNYVHPSDQNYTKLNMISMQSNDIQTVNIPGLSD